MARLKPVNVDPQTTSLITSIELTPELREQVVSEMLRLGVKSRSALIRMILEEYFKQPID